jgi:3-dehydroquinate synthase
MVRDIQQEAFSKLQFCESELGCRGNKQAFSCLFQSLPRNQAGFGKASNRENLAACIARAVEIKGRIVEEDPRETGKRRALLNLGHTFGHALESSAGLGNISHGEAVAWGIARSCELGLYLGVTPPSRARDITDLLKGLGYETRAPYPAGVDAAVLMEAMAGDKKKKSGRLNFIVPALQGAEIVPDPGSGIIGKIINGELSL